MLGDGPDQRETVRCWCRGRFVDDHQAVTRGVVEDVGRFGHLDHGGLPARDLVGAGAGEDAVGWAGASARHITARLGQQHQQGHLADVVLLPAMLAGEDGEDRFGFELSDLKLRRSI